MNYIIAVYRDKALNDLVDVKDMSTCEEEDGSLWAGWGRHMYPMHESKSGTLGAEYYICLAEFD